VAKTRKPTSQPVRRYLQARGFSPEKLTEYLTGLLAPRDRNKTLTCLAGAEPIVGAHYPAVQRLQFFLSEGLPM
jgi:hypothetical protein